MGTFIRSNFISSDATAPRVVPLVARDGFNRANSATPGVTEVGNLAWTAKAGTFNISGGVLSSGDTTSSRPADCSINPGKRGGIITAKVLTCGAGDHAGIVFRKVDLGNTGWVYYARATGHVLAKRSGSDTFTVIAPTGPTIPFGAGETLKVELTGDRIVCSVDGVVTHDVTDGTYATDTGIGLETRVATSEIPAKWSYFAYSLTPGA